MPMSDAIRSSLRPEARSACLSSIRPLDPREGSRLPSILLILMDDMGWGDLSCFGSAAIRTPNLDRLAREGVVLKRCYASSPICSPSRFGLLTGRYPCRGHVRGVFFPTCGFRDDQLAPTGYEEDGVVPSAESRREAAEAMRTFYRRIGETLPVEGILEDEITVADLLKARGYRTGLFGKWHLGDRSPHLPNDMGFDTFFGAHYSNDMSPYHFYRDREIAVEAPFDQARITELLNAELLSFIERSADRPFFACYASPWPHYPPNCGRAFAGRSKAGVYGDCVEEFDAGIGALLDRLRRTDLADRTMVVFTSDNGPWHQGSPGGHRGRKGNPFDGGQIVPTFFWHPAAFSARTVDEQAMHIDFLPTFCEMAGIEPPRDRAIDGRSLLPLLKGETDRSPHDVLFSIDPQYAWGEPGEAARAVWSRDGFKYCGPQPSENAAFASMRIHPFLFDLRHDPDESYDVRRTHPGILAQLRDRLEAFNASVRENPRGWR